MLVLLWTSIKRKELLIGYTTMLRFANHEIAGSRHRFIEPPLCTSIVPKRKVCLQSPPLRTAHWGPTLDLGYFTPSKLAKHI